MVDINLMGEDDNSEDRRREENFAKTVNLDEPGTAAEEKSSSSSYTRDTIGSTFQRDTVSSSFTKKPPELYGENSSRTKAYLIVLGLILAALTVVFFIIQGPSKKSDVEQAPVEIAEEEVPSQIETATGDTMAAAMDTGTDMETPGNIDVMAAFSPRERELVSSTRTSALAVTALANSFSSPNDFTLITYHGNHRFFVEFLSPSSEVANNMTGTMQANVSPLELKTVSESEQPSNGSSLRKVLVAGRMDEQAGLMGVNGSMNNMDADQFSAWIKELGQRHGLKLKRYVSGSRAAGQGDSIPMQIHFAGSNSGIVSFIREFGDANVTVQIAKIILSPSDRRTFEGSNLDLVMHFGFVEMQ